MYLIVDCIRTELLVVITTYIQSNVFVLQTEAAEV
jgi:hypothetical protein